MILGMKYWLCPVFVTILTTGLFTLQCGSSRSVAPIKAGFVAQVGRRKAGS